MAAATVAAPRHGRRDDDIFLSVFPRTSSGQTPEPTPQIGTLASPVQTFGAFSNKSATSNAPKNLVDLHSLAPRQLQQTLTDIMLESLASSLQTNPEKCLKERVCSCQLKLGDHPWRELHDVGLGGLLGERAFAHAVNTFLQGPAIERECFRVEWNGKVFVMFRLRDWIIRQFAPAIQRALSLLTGTDNLDLKLGGPDIRQFVSIASSNLGRLRTLSLFDYVKSWPASLSAILDIREYLNAGTQNDKAHVCQSFSNDIQRRLLHAGASTSEILSIYVNVIPTFKALDSRGVLLEKVAIPIRSYLRARENTVAIIAASFLADTDGSSHATPADADKVCHDITLEVANSTLSESPDTKMLNWDDMNWVPDPIDAGPDYKASRSEDIIAYILGLFEQEEFIKEVTTVLAQHLLHSTDPEYVKATKLIGLFKSRLDASKLQAAEVMLRDMQDSVRLGKRLNPHAQYGAAKAAPPTPKEIQAAIPEGGITMTSLWNMFEGRMKPSHFQSALKLVANKHNDLLYAKRTRLPTEPSSVPSGKRKEGEIDFKAQILSSFFWPQMRSNEFDMPPALRSFPERFDLEFQARGNQRKLQFRPALARVSLRIDLEDRTIEEADVAGWRASVIDAFGSDQVQNDGSIEGLTVEHLASILNMEEELVQDALNFWTNKNVLYQKSTGVYAVLERLDMDVDAMEHEVQQEDTISAVKSQNDMLRESAPMFETFIANMLRNQGPKQVDGMMGITSLLKMVLPTFTYGDDEVAWLLGEMESRGEVTRNGDMWAIVQ